MVQHPELCERFQALALAVTRLISSKASDRGSFPQRLRERYIRTSETQSETQYRTEIIWLGVVRGQGDAIVQLSEYRELRRYAGKIDAVRQYVSRRYPVPAGEKESDDRLSFLFYTILAEPYVIETVRAALTEGQDVAQKEFLDCLYARLEADLYDEPFQVRGLAPVYRLHLEAERVELTPDCRLRRIDDADRDRWLDAENSSFAGAARAAIFNTQSAIEVEQRVRHGETHRLTEDAEEILTAVWLFKFGGMAAPMLYTWRADDWQHGTRWWGTPLGIVRGYIAGPNLILTSMECDRFVSFFDWYRDRVRKHTGGSLGIALSRFARASSDAAAEDRLIDSCVAFDALLSPTSQMEMSYRVAQGVSFLIGRDAAERESISAIMKTAYSARGSVVHGSKTADHFAVKDFNKVTGIQNLDDLVKVVLPLLGKVIRAWLDLAPARKDKVNQIERNIIHGGDLLKDALSEWVHSPCESPVQSPMERSSAP